LGPDGIGLGTPSLGDQALFLRPRSLIGVSILLPTPFQGFQDVISSIVLILKLRFGPPQQETKGAYPIGRECYRTLTDENKDLVQKRQ
jgi:hypothetical protein